MKQEQELVVITKTYDLILWTCNHTVVIPFEGLGGVPLALPVPSQISASLVCSAATELMQKETALAEPVARRITRDVNGITTNHTNRFPRN